ncbi:MAG: PadR family transcriptional regulator [Candidatus Hodarchaeaceae archaeon]|nr:PadR family transcriptional regulator [Candidatus Hodarchaeaceae archaeon]
MKAPFPTENVRKIDVAKSTKFVADNLETLVLGFLYGHTSMSKHEIIQEIFARQGVSVNPSRMDVLLGSLKKRGLIGETRRGLLTAYTLTDKGKEAAKQARTGEFTTLL